MASIWDIPRDTLDGLTIGVTPPPTPQLGDLWDDISDPTNIVLKVYDGALWSALSRVIPGAGGGAALPSATREGQVLIAGPGTTFDWQAGDIDCGRF
jgi:hypothetical protein